jgi:hypothetical protein
MVDKLTFYVFFYVTFHLLFEILMVPMFDTDTDMSPRKKTTSKDPTTKSSARGSRLEEEPTPRGISMMIIHDS